MTLKALPLFVLSIILLSGCTKGCQKDEKKADHTTEITQDADTAIAQEEAPQHASVANK